MKLFLNNPLIGRYYCSLMRPRQFWIYMAIYIIAIVLLLFINYAAYEYRSTFGDPGYLAQSIYYQLLGLQVFILWLWAAYNSSSAVREEITEKTYDFFRLLPLSAGQKAAGIMVGKNLVALVLAAITCALILTFGTMGNVNGVLQVHILVVLVALAILANSLGLLSSMRPGKKGKQGGLIAGIVVVMFILPQVIITSMQLSGVSGLESITADFFRLRIPLLLLISLLALYFSCWAITGVLRKFTREDEPLFTRKGAFLFMLGYEFVLLGLFYSRLIDPDVPVNHLYWLLSLPPILIIPFGTFRGFDRYLEYSGLIRKRLGPKASGFSSMLWYCNPSLALGLFAMWAAGCAGTTLMSGLELRIHLCFIGVLFSFYLFLVLLLELNVVYTPLSSKVGLLLAFIAGVLFLLPVILSAIIEDSMIHLYSPIGFFWHIFLSESTPSLLRLASICVLNLMLCVVPATLIQSRYVQILAARRKM